MARKEAASSVQSRKRKLGSGPNTAIAQELLAATAEDVERKRHKKKPFDHRYLQLCLSEFDQVLTGVQITTLC